MKIPSAHNLLAMCVWEATPIGRGASLTGGLRQIIK